MLSRIRYFLQPAALRRREQENVLVALWRVQHTRSNIAGLSDETGIRANRIRRALRVLAAAGLVNHREQLELWELTPEGQRVAGIKAGATARRIQP